MPVMTGRKETGDGGEGGRSACWGAMKGPGGGRSAGNIKNEGTIAGVESID